MATNDLARDLSSRIINVRGSKVLLDSDLAALYGVSTMRFNEAIKRNQARFPADFCFRLTEQEIGNLISQFAISSLRPAKHGAEVADTAHLEITEKILLVRGHRVVLDETLAALYGVETRTLNQAVRRNRERFPADFLFEITPEECEILRSQFVILRSGRIPMDAPIGCWVYKALKTTPAAIGGLDPVRIRMMGGTVPTDVLVEALKLPFVLVPTVNGDNNQHARDENLRMGQFITGTEAIVALLSTPYP